MILLEPLVELREKDLIFSQARETANRLGKPLLNAGCGIWYQRAISESDVNIDAVPRSVPNFIQATVENLSIFSDKQFGAVFCSHVLEHVGNLEKARSELQRVADYQFIITPSPLFLTNWFCPGHRRIFKDVSGEEVLLELPLKPWLRRL